MGDQNEISRALLCFGWHIKPLVLAFGSSMVYDRMTNHIKYNNPYRFIPVHIHTKIDSAVYIANQNRYLNNINMDYKYTYMSASINLKMGAICSTKINIRSHFLFVNSFEKECCCLS
jgi:hypothetical protein